MVGTAIGTVGGTKDDSNKSDLTIDDVALVWESIHAIDLNKDLTSSPLTVSNEPLEVVSHVPLLVRKVCKCINESIVCQLCLYILYQLATCPDPTNSLLEALIRRPESLLVLLLEWARPLERPSDAVAASSQSLTMFARLLASVPPRVEPDEEGPLDRLIVHNQHVDMLCQLILSRSEDSDESPSQSPPLNIDTASLGRAKSTACELLQLIITHAYTSFEQETLPQTPYTSPTKKRGSPFISSPTHNIHTTNTFIQTTQQFSSSTSSDEHPLQGQKIVTVKNMSFIQIKSNIELLCNDMKLLYYLEPYTMTSLSVLHLFIEIADWPMSGLRYFSPLFVTTTVVELLRHQEVEYRVAAMQIVYSGIKYKSIEISNLLPRLLQHDIISCLEVFVDTHVDMLFLSLPTKGVSPRIETLEDHDPPYSRLAEAFTLLAHLSTISVAVVTPLQLSREPSPYRRHSVSPDATYDSSLNPFADGSSPDRMPNPQQQQQQQQANISPRDPYNSSPTKPPRSGSITRPGRGMDRTDSDGFPSTSMDAFDGRPPKPFRLSSSRSESTTRNETRLSITEHLHTSSSSSSPLRHSNGQGNHQHMFDTPYHPYPQLNPRDSFHQETPIYQPPRDIHVLLSAVLRKILSFNDTNLMLKCNDLHELMTSINYQNQRVLLRIISSVATDSCGCDYLLKFDILGVLESYLRISITVKYDDYSTNNSNNSNSSNTLSRQYRIAEVNLLYQSISILCCIQNRQSLTLIDYLNKKLNNNNDKNNILYYLCRLISFIAYYLTPCSSTTLIKHEIYNKVLSLLIHLTASNNSIVDYLNQGDVKTLIGCDILLINLCKRYITSIQPSHILILVGKDIQKEGLSSQKGDLKMSYKWDQNRFISLFALTYRLPNPVAPLLDQSSYTTDICEQESFNMLIITIEYVIYLGINIYSISEVMKPTSALEALCCILTYYDTPITTTTTTTITTTTTTTTTSTATTVSRSVAPVSITFAALDLYMRVVMEIARVGCENVYKITDPAVGIERSITCILHTCISIIVSSPYLDVIEKVSDNVH